VPFPYAASGVHPRESPGPQPRNLAFADGLDGWQLNGSFQDDLTGAHWHDYHARATHNRGAVLAAAVPEPVGQAALSQTILAGNYRGQTVSSAVSCAPATSRTRTRRLYLQVIHDQGPPVPGQVWAPGRSKPALSPPGDGQDWARRVVTAHVPDDAVFVTFGIILTGLGRIELRNAELVSGAQHGSRASREGPAIPPADARSGDRGRA